MTPEKSLAERIANCDVYHVNHHGSETTSSAVAFVQALDPEVSVVSNGTAYGHPRRVVAERLPQEVDGPAIFVQTNHNDDAKAYQGDPKYVADDTLNEDSESENLEGAQGTIRIIVDPISDNYYVVMPGLELQEGAFPIEKRQIASGQ